MKHCLKSLTISIIIKKSIAMKRSSLLRCDPLRRNVSLYDQLQLKILTIGPIERKRRRHIIWSKSNFVEWHLTYLVDSTLTLSFGWKISFCNNWVDQMSVGKMFFDQMTRHQNEAIYRFLSDWHFYVNLGCYWNVPASR